MTRKLVRAAVAALALGAASTQSAPAQIDSVLQGFEPTGKFRLVVAGEEQPKAQIYESERAPALIVISSALPSPLLVETSSSQVSPLQMLKVSKRTDGRLDLLADAAIEPAAKIKVVGAEASFTFGGKAVVLKPSPYLLGSQPGAALLESSFGYQWRAKTYEPEAGPINRLRNEKRDVRVLTFFGTWCPHCAKHVPLLLKVEQRLADSKIRFDYHGLPQGFSGEAEAKSWKVDSVPTTIVLVGGKEVGRIPATQWTNPEVALDLILHPNKATS
jgi:thiol-disulfide isomerase/thioredoxin